MNRSLYNRVDIRKKNSLMLLFFPVLFAFWSIALPADADAELTRLNSEELRACTGTGAVDFSIIGDTARIYFDVHVETYMEIDSLKLGYYNRSNLTTRKFLAPEDPMVMMLDNDGDGHEEEFSLWPYINGSGPQVPVYYKPNGNLLGYRTPHDWLGYGEGAKYETWSLTPGTALISDFDPGTPIGPFPSYLYTEVNGTPHYLPYTDNDNYQTKYNDTLGARYVEGLQGKNDEELIGVTHFSSYPTPNQNHLDWDVNVENLRFGTHPGDPMVIDGLVIHLKYDDITSPNKKLTDIIFGTNCMEGDFYGDFLRITGFLNPKLPHSARDQGGGLSLEDTGNFSKVFNEAPVPVSMKRDSFLMLVDHYRAEYFDDEPGLDNKVYYPVPDNPTNNDIHTGFFLRLGLDPNDAEHFGYALIVGYNEIVANAYEPQGEMLQDSLYNWWNGPNM